VRGEYFEEHIAALSAKPRLSGVITPETERRR
jgi:hypothetical protein